MKTDWIEPETLFWSAWKQLPRGEQAAVAREAIEGFLERVHQAASHDPRHEASRDPMESHRHRIHPVLWQALERERGVLAKARDVRAEWKAWSEDTKKYLARRPVWSVTDLRPPWEVVKELLVQQISEPLVGAVVYGAPPPLLELELAAESQILLESRLELRRDARVEQPHADLLVQSERARVEVRGADVRPDLVHDDDLLMEQRGLELVEPHTGFEQRVIEVAAGAPHELAVRVLAGHHQMHLHAAPHHHREQLDHSVTRREVGFWISTSRRAVAIATV